jgi:hypothetical protein
LGLLEAIRVLCLLEIIGVFCWLWLWTTSLFALIFVEVELYVFLLCGSCAPPIVYFEIAILGRVLVGKVILLRLLEWFLWHQIVIHVLPTL